MNDTFKKVEYTGLDRPEYILKNGRAFNIYAALPYIENQQNEIAELKAKIANGKIWAEKTLAANDYPELHYFGATPDWFVGLAAFCCDVKPDAEENMSGCELKNNIESIGYEDIAKYSDTDELLKHFVTSDLIDSICNDNNRDIHHIIKELFYAELELNSKDESSLKSEINNLLSKINL